MSRNHGIDVSDGSEVNVAGNMVAGDVNFHLPSPDISVDELQSRLNRERAKIREYEQEIEDVVYKGATQYHSSVVAIAKNAVRTKTYIEGYIQEILNRGGDAKTKGYDLEINVRLTRAFHKGRRRRIIKRTAILCGVGACVLLLLTKFAPNTANSTPLTFFTGSRGEIQPAKTVVSEAPGTTTIEAPGYTSIRMSVTAPALNVRTQANGDATIVGKLFQSETVVVEQQISNEAGEWFLIRRASQKGPELKGWVSGKHLTPLDSQ